MSTSILDLSKPVPAEHERVEHIKNANPGLRGTIAEGLRDPLTGGLSEEDTHLIKYHGLYLQDDRELRNERRRSKLEPAYSFLIRVRVPGGICTAEQYLEMDRIANTLANGTLKLTTRQAFQFHGVRKRHLRQAMQEILAAGLDTVAGSGDVNRNVMCNVNPQQSRVHGDVYRMACEISKHLTPRSMAYGEVWLDEGAEVPNLPDTCQAEESIYSRRYLPRKFKIALAIPPHNDVDVYANDIGLIAVEEGGVLAGFNVAVGGGMSLTHGETDTYPRLASVIGFIGTARVVEVVEQLLILQRDFGCRTNRKRARFKYTVDDYGLDFIQAELSRRCGFGLEPARPVQFERNGDHYGWREGLDGREFLTLFVEGGRVRDREGNTLMSALREVAQSCDGVDFRLTGNQNLMIGNVSTAGKAHVEGILRRHGIGLPGHLSGLRRNALACVALPTCCFAMAEAERYLPSLIDKLETLIRELGLWEEEIVIRMTGCPNGCGRPFLGEIGFVGKGPGKYNLYLGAGFRGERLNKLYRENIGEAEILEALEPVLTRYARERAAGERFGDFVLRAGLVGATREGRDFHEAG